KRFDLLIDAVARLRATGRDLTLLIVGDGSLRKTIADRIAHAGLQSRCVLLGERADIIDLHHAFDLFVQSSDYEGTSNAVLEAMALETPIVATDAGGTSDIIRHEIDGLIVPRGSLDPLVEAIERVLANSNATSARVASARRRVETDLAFDARMVAIETIYTELF